MKRVGLVVLVSLISLGAFGQGRSFVGFDRNTYPGDTELRELAKTFAFTGYWLNNPPGATANTWRGHRRAVIKAGMGFLVLWNGRLYRELKTGAAELGSADGRAAAEAARNEGFKRGTILFLDQEEGGRLLPEQRAYLHAWVDAVAGAGYKAGVYCSGIPAKEGGGATVVTAEDIRKNAGRRKIAYWVANDVCPPAPGCVASVRMLPSESGVKFADVWQYSQSPMREMAAEKCRETYDKTTNCYAPGTKIDMDMNVAGKRDPSGGR